MVCFGISLSVVGDDSHLFKNESSHYMPSTYVFLMWISGREETFCLNAR